MVRNYKNIVIKVRVRDRFYLNFDLTGIDSKPTRTVEYARHSSTLLPVKTRNLSVKILVLQPVEKSPSSEASRGPRPIRPSHLRFKKIIN